MTTMLVLGAVQAAHADIFIGGTNVWTIVAGPSPQTLNGSPVEVVTFSNHLAVDVAGIVIMVLKNASGQTVYFTTSTITLSGGPTASIGSAYLVAFGLPAGTYSATFFAFTFGGVAISTPTTSSLTITGP